MNSDYALDDMSPQPPPKVMQRGGGGGGETRTQVDELQPILLAPGKVGQEDVDSPYDSGARSALKRIGLHAARFFAVVALFIGLLAIPWAVNWDYADIGDSTNDYDQARNIIYWIFYWLWLVWIIGSAVHLFALLLPYIFWFVAKYVNPAHRRCESSFHLLEKQANNLKTGGSPDP